MMKLLRRELWRILFCLCLLIAAAALLWLRINGETLPLWIAAALVLWCLLLWLSRCAGAWGPAALCLLALLLSLLPIARTARNDLPDLVALAAHPAFIPSLLSLCSLLFWYAPDRFALRAGAALVWLGLWMTAALLGWKLPRLMITALLPLLLLAACETGFRLLRRGGPADFAPVRGALCLVLALASLLTALVPTPAEPYGYPVIRAIVRKAEELMQDVKSRIGRRWDEDTQFSLYFNGMAEQPETGKASGEGGQGCLFIQPYSATDSPLYLFGNAWDRFDGRNWTQAVTEEKESALLWNADTLEHVYALWRWQEAHGGVDDERFFRANSIYILYRDLNTRTMFSAMNALYFYYDEELYPSAAGANGILFDYMQTDDTAYRMYWLEANPRTLNQLIAFSEGYSYDPAERRVWHALMERYEPRFHLDIWEGEVLEVLLSQRQALIRSRDLDTEGVSPLAADLAAKITADCRTDYEKLRAIAAYLQDNYHYTLSPTPVPEGKNFLDWLLFETGEGYCTWFATAAALLARSVGIPTRYVQGYRAGALPTRRYTSLGAESAHAWCEGYVAGYGWVTVEATPGFSAEGYGWIPPDEADRAALPEMELSGQQGNGKKIHMADEGEAVLHLPGNTGIGTEPEIGTEGVPGTEPESKSEPETATDSEPVSRLWYLLLLPPGLALILAALWLLRRQQLRKRYLEAPRAEQVRQDLGRLLVYLRRRGYPRAPEHSVYACFAAISWRYLPVEREQALSMAEFYESVLFGGHVPTPEEMTAQRSFVETLRPKRRRLFR